MVGSCDCAERKVIGRCMKWGVGYIWWGVVIVQIERLSDVAAG